MAMITDEIEKLKNLPAFEQQVCGSCQFFRERGSYLDLSKCLAVGGHDAHETWLRICKGNLWQPRLSIWRRFKRWAWQ